LTAKSLLQNDSNLIQTTTLFHRANPARSLAFNRSNVIYSIQSQPNYSEQTVADVDCDQGTAFCYIYSVCSKPIYIWNLYCAPSI